jgi:hypothetical protein
MVLGDEDRIEAQGLGALGLSGETRGEPAIVEEPGRDANFHPQACHPGTISGEVGTPLAFGLFRALDGGSRRLAEKGMS